MKLRKTLVSLWLAAFACGCASPAPPKNATVQKIPLLGDIPGLGVMFRHTVDTQTASDSVAAGDVLWDGAYVVRKGDSFSKIASAFGVTVHDLMAHNQIKDPNKIRIGQKLIVPRRGPEATPEVDQTTSALATLPEPVWPPEAIAIADLTAYTLSQGEAKTLTDKLHTTIVQTKYFRVLSRTEMKDVLEAQKFQRSDACDDSVCLVEMGKILSVQKIIGGSIGRVGSTFSLTLRLVNVETGQTEVTTDRQTRAEPDQLLTLTERAGRELALMYAERRGREE